MAKPSSKKSKSKKPSPIVMSEEDYRRMNELQEIIGSDNKAIREAAAKEVDTLMVKAVRTAAEAGDTEMMMKMARWYTLGLHVDKDPVAAELWRIRAEKAGVSDDCPVTLGTPQDLMYAIHS